MKKNKEFTWDGSSSVGNYSTNLGDAKIYTGDPYLGSGQTSGYYGQYYFNCVELLPCGICRLTNKVCPKYGWQPTWIGSPVWTCDSDKVRNFTTTTFSDGTYKTINGAQCFGKKK